MSLYSCFIVDPALEHGEGWRPFAYGRGQQVSGSHQTATAAHTNVPRPAYAGLPMRWGALLTHCRAITNVRLSEVVLDWAAETAIMLHHNGSTFWQSPLIDVLMAPQPFRTVMRRNVRTNVDEPGLWLRESESWEMNIEASAKATSKLQNWLISHAIGERLLCWIYLDGVVTRGSP